jgi:two-component system cell cycle response regulator DivK
MNYRTKKVLVVEDSEDCRELLVMIISRLGYEVIEAATGLDGIYHASTLQPDLIFMDISLPGTTGLEATHHLKTHRSTRDIPIVINTAYAGASIVKQALEAGAAEILHKPFGLLVLQDVLRRYLSPSNEPAEAHSAGAAPLVYRSSLAEDVL